MIEPSSGSASEFETLPDRTLVYRALRKGWIDRDRSIVKSDAYYLRKNINEQGISVNFSIEQSLSALRNCEGVASLDLGKIRELGLNVVRDSSSHGSIIGLPYREDNRPRADELALLLARQSRIVWESSSS
ncbi:hypothetical protein Osc7112_3139 [Oscillatoria nigro-viridis PCC 7112]|uniref:Uncharacterized protein n=1 Tax=Phormidium nigroviride PCC 7112 TaxID=179408 RepID=K9VJY5_9CYAN|nr:hypothetical protein Osc7112_3139 [Oscillatoria nigro-viridis PCC 7112]